MENKNILVGIVVLISLVTVGYFLYFGAVTKGPSTNNLDSTPRNAILSGTFVCLPHVDANLNTKECAFGLKTDDGQYYAVNFGQSENAMSQFRSGAHITAEGFIIIKEALNSDQWQKYDMKGIFTVTKIIGPTPMPPVQGKLNINVICEGALAYMTFTDAKSADTFVAECKEGKHPEVIEQYKKQMNLGEGVAI